MVAATTPITNAEDIIDSRDIIARIEELELFVEDCQGFVSLDDHDCNLGEEHDELTALKALAEEAETSSDWEYGETLIRDSYFEEYAEEMASDIGAIDPRAKWPLNHIDWKAAADELKADYMEVDFDGVAYWIRA